LVTDSVCHGTSSTVFRSLVSQCSAALRHDEPCWDCVARSDGGRRNCGWQGGRAPERCARSRLVSRPTRIRARDHLARGETVRSSRTSTVLVRFGSQPNRSAPRSRKCVECSNAKAFWTPEGVSSRREGRTAYAERWGARHITPHLDRVSTAWRVRAGGRAHSVGAQGTLPASS